MSEAEVTNPVRPSEKIDPDEFHSLFEWDQGNNARKNIGYCALTGRYFPDREPGDECPLCEKPLERLPDERGD